MRLSIPVSYEKLPKKYEYVVHVFCSDHKDTVQARNTYNAYRRVKFTSNFYAWSLQKTWQTLQY